MRKDIKTNKVVQALAIGLAASMAMAQPIEVMANSAPVEPSEGGEGTTVAEKVEASKVNPATIRDGAQAAVADAQEVVKEEIFAGLVDDAQDALADAEGEVVIAMGSDKAADMELEKAEAAKDSVAGIVGATQEIVDKANEAVDEKLENIKNATTIEGANAENADLVAAVEDAKLKFEEKNQAYEDAKAAYEAAADMVAKLQEAYDNAVAGADEDAYAAAEKLQAAKDEADKLAQAAAEKKTAAEEALTAAQKAEEGAKTAYETARDAEKSTEEAYLAAQQKEAEAKTKYETARDAEAAAETAVAVATKAEAEAKTKYETARDAEKSTEEAYLAAQKAEAEAKTAYETARDAEKTTEEAYLAAQKAEAEAKTAYEAAKGAEKTTEEAYIAAQKTLADAETKLKSALTTKGTEETELAAAKAEYDAAVQAVTSAETALNNARTDLAAKTTIWTDAKDKNFAAKGAYATAQEATKEANSAWETAKADNFAAKGEYAAAQEKTKEANSAWETAKADNFAAKGAYAAAQQATADAQTKLKEAQKAHGADDVQAALKIQVTVDDCAKWGVNWDQQDKMFEAILQYYYFPKELNGSEVLSVTKHKDADDHQYNYFEVEYKDADGKVTTGYYNFKLEAGDTNYGAGDYTIEIFEKRPEEVQAAREKAGEEFEAYDYDGYVYVDENGVEQKLSADAELISAKIKAGEIVEVDGVYKIRLGNGEEASLLKEGEVVVAGDEPQVSYAYNEETGEIVKTVTANVTTITYEGATFTPENEFTDAALRDADLEAEEAEIKAAGGKILDVEKTDETTYTYKAEGTYVPTFTKTVEVSTVVEKFLGEGYPWDSGVHSEKEAIKEATVVFDENAEKMVDSLDSEEWYAIGTAIDNITVTVQEDWDRIFGIPVDDPDYIVSSSVSVTYAKVNKSTVSEDDAFKEIFALYTEEQTVEKNNSGKHYGKDYGKKPGKGHETKTETKTVITNQSELITALRTAIENAGGIFVGCDIDEDNVKNTQVRYVAATKVDLADVEEKGTEEAATQATKAAALAQAQKAGNGVYNVKTADAEIASSTTTYSYTISYDERKESAPEEKAISKTTYAAAEAEGYVTQNANYLAGTLLFEQSKNTGYAEFMLKAADAVARLEAAKNAWETASAAEATAKTAYETARDAEKSTEEAYLAAQKTEADAKTKYEAARDAEKNTEEAYLAAQKAEADAKTAYETARDAEKAAEEVYLAAAKTLAEAQTKLEGALTTKGTEEKELAVAKAEYDAAADAVTSAETDLNNARTDLEGKTKTWTAAKADNFAAKGEYAAAQEATKKANSAWETAKAGNFAAKGVYAAAQETTKEANSAWETAKADNFVAKGAYAATQETTKDANSAWETAKADNFAAKGEYAAAQETTEDAKKKLAEAEALSTEANGAAAAVLAAQEAVKELQKSIAEMQNVPSKEAELEALKAELEIALAAKAATEEAFADVQDKLEVALAELAKTIDRLTPDDYDDDEVVVETPVVAVAPAPVAVSTITPVEPTVEEPVVEITENEVPLAEEIEETEEAVEEEAPVVIEEEEVPLAAAPVDAEDTMSWWWLIVVAVLGTTGAEMYRRHKNKKAEAMGKRNDK